MIIQCPTRGRLWAGALGPIIAGLILACTQASHVPALTAARRGDSLTLSLSPSAVSADRVGTTPQVAFDVGGQSTDIGYPIDVEELPGGRIAALDLETPGIWLLDPSGRPLKRIGRQGDGPGELQSPIGVTRAGHLLVVTGVRKDRALAFIDTNGRSVTHYPPPVPGDWSRAPTRPPGPGTDLPRYSGNEDVARRLVTFDDTTVAILLTSSEWEHPPDAGDPDRMSPQPVVAIRVSVTSGRVIDTLWRGLTPEARRDQFRADLMPNWPFPIFAPWPSLASGDGWTAWTTGGAGEIQLAGGVAIRSIRWQVRPFPIDDRLKEMRFDWLKRVLIRQDDHWEAWWDSIGPAVRAEAKQDEMTRYPWASMAPEVMAMFGFGHCLWVAGFSLDDGPLGVGRSWIAFDVIAGRLLGVVRLPDPWWRLRSVGAGGMFATYRDEDGLSHLVKLAYPAGFESCGR